eukprot:8546108-Heterocapsa_arctica.AAC.1
MSNDPGKGNTLYIAMYTDPPKGPVTHLPLTGGYRRLPPVTGGSGRPLIRFLNRTAGLSNKSEICNGRKHMLSQTPLGLKAQRII